MAEYPPTPKNILRGHKASVHAATFFRDNERLVTGDADGFVVVWDLVIMRPRAVWQAHENAILGIRGWGTGKLITHGRDHKLIVWQLETQDEERLSDALPLDPVATPRPQPWVLHLLEVNTMNFCSFASCPVREPMEGAIKFDKASAILVAVPNTLASEAIDIYGLPSQTRVHTIHPGAGNGMAMALELLHKEGSLFLIAAFENGYASVHMLQSDGQWTMTYRSQPHSQPILSMALHPSLDFFITSGADAILAKHPIPVAQQTVIPPIDRGPRVVEIVDEEVPSENPSFLSEALGGSSQTPKTSSATSKQPWQHPLKEVNTKHAGQQGLQIRADGRIFATAGWDSKARVYSCKTMKELAVLEWHKVGCYAIAFPDSSAAASSNASELKEEMDGSRVKAEVPSAPTLNTNRTMAAINQSRSLVKERRYQQAKTTNWLAAGAKDGKISLWNIY